MKCKIVMCHKNLYVCVCIYIYILVNWNRFEERTRELLALLEQCPQ